MPPALFGHRSPCWRYFSSFFTDFYVIKNLFCLFMLWVESFEVLRTIKIGKRLKKQTKISIKKAKISEWRCTEYQTIILNKPSHHSLLVSRRKIVGARAFGQALSPPVPNKSDWTFPRTYWVIECDFFFLNHLDYV